MKKRIYFTGFCFILILLSGCSVITGIFKAGAVVGVLAVVIIVAIIIWIISLVRGRSK